MYTFDINTAKLVYADRLHEAEQFRLVQQAQANQPSTLTHLLQNLGELLITLGTHLKAPPQQKFA